MSHALILELAPEAERLALPIQTTYKELFPNGLKQSLWGTLFEDYNTDKHKKLIEQVHKEFQQLYTNADIILRICKRLTKTDDGTREVRPNEHVVTRDADFEDRIKYILPIIERIKLLFGKYSNEAKSPVVVNIVKVISLLFKNTNFDDLVSTLNSKFEDYKLNVIKAHLALYTFGKKKSKMSKRSKKSKRSRKSKRSKKSKRTNTKKTQKKNRRR
jgi:hypothetical protein